MLTCKSSMHAAMAHMLQTFVEQPTQAQWHGRLWSLGGEGVRMTLDTLVWRKGGAI